MNDFAGARRRHRFVLVFAFSCAVAALGLMSGPGRAAAAAPVARASYAGVKGDRTAWGELRVSPGRRSFDGGRSRFELVLAGCGHPELSRPFAVGGRSPRARIRRGGRFRLTRRRGAAALRVSGRFSSPNRARVSFAYRSPTCRQGGRLTLRRVRRGRSAGCAARGTTLLWTPQARIIKRRAGPIDEGIEVRRRYAYGCLFSRGRPFTLGEDEEGQPDSDLRLFRLAGPYAAFAQDECPMGCGFSVGAVDLRNGRTVRSSPAGVPGPGSPYGGAASDLVLKPTSSLAWISAGNPTRVFALDSLGSRQLDSGAGIDPRSLELNGSTVTWVKAGASRSGALF